MRVRYVVAGEQAPLRALRLAALAADPGAFGSTHAREDGMPGAWWEEWAAESGDGDAQRTFVLVGDDERWLGLALARLGDTPGAAALYAMWVAPEARGRGAAGRLCEACAAWAAERGAEELRLTVKVGNDGARRAYERCGFRVDGQEADEMLLTRDL